MPTMKVYKLFLFTLLLSTSIKSLAQSSVSQIFTDDKSYYITNRIGFPILGTYLFEGKTQPTVELNENGLGVLQGEDLKKRNILWGIQSSKSGTPKFKKGFDSAAYTIWYKYRDLEESEDDKWIESHFSIHFRVKKMFVFGNRSKTYVDEN